MKPYRPVYRHPIEAILSISIGSYLKLFSYNWSLDLLYGSEKMFTFECKFLASKCKNGTQFQCNPKFKGSNNHLIKKFSKFDELNFSRKTIVERKVPQSVVGLGGLPIDFSCELPCVAALGS